ncbi:MAG: DUF4138 domain-containing protein [candidate division KSB1 bacterium]|nr:DUF4138 domain-containing protein [candidate division KSB1 bacterium]
MRKDLFHYSNLIILLALVVPVAAQNRQTVRVAPGYATVIVCPAPPDLVTVGNVDAFSVQSAGNYILVKPLISKGRTNMFIKAGTESFNLLLEISDKPDLTVKLASATLPMTPEEQPPAAKSEGEKRGKTAAAAKRKPLTSYSPRVIATLASLLKATNRYTHSVNNSRVIFAIDHLKQIDENLFVIGTIINNSNVPYDIGFVQFKMIEYARSYIFWKKKKKETELEPVSDYYNSIVKAHTSRRLMFVFDKQGFSANNTLYIKCDEENGRRVLELEVPASMIQ